MENFVLYDEIGSGTKRTVYKGRRKGSVEYVAIHCIEKAKRALIQNNVRISYELDHKNIVRFYEWYETSNHLWLVVELCAGDSLNNILEQDQYLPEPTVKEFGKDLVCGLLYLHSLGVIYADLCPSKVLLDSDGTLKFSNFCLAKLCDVNESIENTFQNINYNEKDDLMRTQFYAAPEVLRGEPRSRQSDLWALGCLLYNMFTGSPPFKGNSIDTLNQQIMDEKVAYPIQGHGGTFKKASENLFMLIQGLLQKDPSQRIDWLELCLHPFWNNELSHLADLYDVKTSHSIMTVASSFTDEGTSRQNNQQKQQQEYKETHLQSNTNSDEEEKSRPDTVPKANIGKKLQTQSLNFPDEKEMLTSSIKSVVDDKNQGWKSTYKIERGLAIMDLTDIEHDSILKDIQEDEKNTQYAKSREITKTTRASHQSFSAELNLNNSLNSVTSQGFSEIIPHLGGPDLNVLDHLYHQSDLMVSPIAENRNIVKLPQLKWDQNALGFTVIQSDKIRTNGVDDIMKYIDTIMSAYTPTRKGSQDKAALRQKMHVLAYLINTAKMEEIANNILCDQYIAPFLTDMKGQHQDLKKRIARLLSVIASHATYINPSFNMSEIFSVTTDQLKQNFRVAQTKESILPVIGEFLFYAATQEETEDRILQKWEPPGAVFTLLVKCLQLQGDEYIARLMAAKIIENIISTTGRYSKKFISNEIGLGLWKLYSHAASDIERVTAASALCRIGMHSPVVIQHVSDRAGFDTFKVGLHTGNQRTQQAFVTMFMNLMTSSTHAKRILQDQTLLPKLMQNLDSPSLVLKGKMYLLLAEMSVRSYAVLLSCCELRLISFIERDSRKVISSGHEDKEALDYMHQCLTVIVNNVVRTLPRILEGIIHILATVSGRHHPNPAQTKQLKIHLPLSTIFLYMITSSMFRKRISDANFIAFTGKLLSHVQKINNGETNLSGQNVRSLGENLTTTMFSIVEAIAQHPPLMVENQNVFINEVLPVLVSFVKSEDGNLRMLSLKLFSDISTFFLESENEEMTTARNDKSKRLLLQVVQDHFIPEFENLMDDQDPLPAYTLKLTHACTEKSRDLLRALLERNLMPTLLNILQTNQGDVSSTVLQNAVGIINSVVSEKDVNMPDLCQDGLFEQLSSVFLDVAAAIDNVGNSNSNVSHLLLQLLDAINHILRHIETAVKRVLSAKQHGTASSNVTNKQQVEQLLQQAKVFSELSGILINLLIYDDTEIQEWSCRCLYLSAELFGADYDECFTAENIECIVTAVKSSPHKRQKLLLRIVKRYTTCSSKFKSICRKSRINDILQELSQLDPCDNDSKSIRNVSNELINLLT